MLGMFFSSKLDWSSYIISIAKTASKKTGALIHTTKFLLSVIAPYLYKSNMQPSMKYCCHFQAFAPSYFLDMQPKLQKQICQTVGLSFTDFLEPIAHHLYKASLRLFYVCCFGKYSSELAKLVPFPYSCGRST